MNANINPLRHIPDTHVRHMILQVLAWMWCMTFAFYIGSVTVFGISAIAHVVFLAAIVVTVATFETAKKGGFNLRLEQKTNGYHTPSRTRHMYYDGKRIELDPNDPGGEHE
ncbi:MAG: hypothetical protein VXZ76_03120 [Bacteroidota bacterium]|nr:hypothetical protein [Bacteroidota bacterium]